MKANKACFNRCVLIERACNDDFEPSYFHLMATDYEEEEEEELTWPSSSLRLDVRAMAGVSVSE